VNITRGFTGARLKEDAEIRGGREGHERGVERSADVLGNLNALSDDVRQLIEGAGREGLAGEIVDGRAGVQQLQQHAGEGQPDAGEHSSGKAHWGNWWSRTRMYTKVDEGLDNVKCDSADVRAQKGTIGKLMYDPTLYDQAKQAITNGQTMIGECAREGHVREAGHGRHSLQ